ncbi:MAG: methyltransferase domain-containing protein [Candidatus Thermoplasmatota archaeon]|nr:methyltransferase domain-containing protein [Candidatus Thermoplasmatota archaeon]
MMPDRKEAWERWYSRNPTFWKGSLLPLPVLTRGARVLDVGCGTGSTMLQALEMGYDVVGTDISPTAISRAKKRISARGYTPDVREGDILSPEDGPGTFDCILFHHILDNLLLDERKIAVENARRLLAEGGCISFQDLSVNDVRYGSGEEIEENTFVKGNGIVLHFFTMEEVRELFGNMTEVELIVVDREQGRGKGRYIRSRISGLFQLSSGETLGSTSGT